VGCVCLADKKMELHEQNLKSPLHSEQNLIIMFFTIALLEINQICLFRIEVDFIFW
jgi:hypothetical protein